jgi:hypothetical protein
MRHPQKQLEWVWTACDVDSVAFKNGKASSALHQSIGRILILETLRGLAVM